MSNDQILQNKTIIVTGASTGIGQAFSVACSSYGAKIIVADMNSGEETVEIIKSKGGEAKFVEVDVANEKSTDLMVKAAYDWTGHLDGLINNAAYFREVKLTPFEEIDVAVWDKIFDVNVKGIWQCSKAVIPYMRNNNGGSIINISSVVAVAGQPGYLHYVATKGAVLAITKGLAKECGKDLVRVNTIAPGFVITDATKNRPIEWQQTFLKARAISREQRPEDLVGTAVYLLSDLSSFVSGQTHVVDGGHIMF
jgi:NAD(P)-dependent dehydrogenase (short-subunit alcohol dehydrogenase family)